MRCSRRAVYTVPRVHASAAVPSRISTVLCSPNADYGTMHVLETALVAHPGFGN